MIDRLDVAEVDPTGEPQVVAGMNLDGLVSDGFDDGCLHRDYTSPPPDGEPGVDNQLGPILSAIGASIDADFGSVIAAGELLILIVVTAAPSGRQFAFHLGAPLDGGPPVLVDGRLAPGQRFRIVGDLGVLLEESDAGGRSRTSDGVLLFPIVPHTDELLSFVCARMHVDVSPLGMDVGVIGGAYEVDEAAPALVRIDPEEIPEGIAHSVVSAQADIDPYELDRCARVSAGFVFTAVPAEIAD